MARPAEGRMSPEKTNLATSPSTLQVAEMTTCIECGPKSIYLFGANDKDLIARNRKSEMAVDISNAYYNIWVTSCRTIVKQKNAGII